MTKTCFLGDHDGAFDALFEDTDRQYLPLLEEWILPLDKAIFRHVPEFSTLLEHSYGRLGRALGRKDDELIEKYMEKFRESSERADKMITYDKFKEIISK